MVHIIVTDSWSPNMLYMWRVNSWSNCKAWWLVFWNNHNFSKTVAVFNNLWHVTLRDLNRWYCTIGRDHWYFCRTCGRQIKYGSNKRKELMPSIQAMFQERYTPRIWLLVHNHCIYHKYLELYDRNPSQYLCRQDYESWPEYRLRTWH